MLPMRPFWERRMMAAVSAAHTAVSLQRQRARTCGATSTRRSRCSGNARGPVVQRQHGGLVAAATRADLWCSVNTAVKQHGGTAPRQCSNTAVQQHGGRATRRYSNMSVQQQCRTAKQRHTNTAVQQEGSRATWRYNNNAAQQHSGTPTQWGSNMAVQQ